METVLFVKIEIKFDETMEQKLKDSKNTRHLKENRTMYERYLKIIKKYMALIYKKKVEYLRENSINLSRNLL